MLSIEALREVIENSELGQEWINNPLLNKDIWSVEEIGYGEEDSKIIGIRNIYFKDFSLPWLKVLAKLTALSILRNKKSLYLLSSRISHLIQLDKFLIEKGYFSSELLTDKVLYEYITTSGGRDKRNIQSTIIYVVRLWSEEQWLKLSYTPRKYQKPILKVEIIPEEVLHRIYENFDLFPPPLERLFRLQLVLGCRIGELLRMPRQCLKKEGEQWFLLRWVQKRKHWRFYQVHFSVVELIREQQKFLDAQLSSDSDFDKLFCKASVSLGDGADMGGRFEAEPIYTPEYLRSSVIRNWLRDFAETIDLRDRHNTRFNLKSHMFRRTKASVMAYCEAEDEYIAAVLGHGSLDMLQHYRKRSLERLEKETDVKAYVNMYGGITSFKPKKQRYEKLAEIIEIKVSTPLGACHRPRMLGDCQYRYACLSCIHHRVTLEDKPKIEADIQYLQQDLEQAKDKVQERRITEINRLLRLLISRLQGLENLENFKGEKK